MPLPNAIDHAREVAANRGRRLPNLGGIHPLPASLARIAPDELRDASAAFAAALDALSTARAHIHEARAGIGTAEVADQAAARRALDAGKDPAKAKVPSAKEAVHDAERLAEASEIAARERLVEYVAAIHAHRDQLLAAATDKANEATREVGVLVDQLADALRRRTDFEHLIQELRSPVGGRNPQFSPRVGALRRDQSEALASIR
jgi:hypothetical protein